MQAPSSRSAGGLLVQKKLAHHPRNRRHSRPPESLPGLDPTGVWRGERRSSWSCSTRARCSAVGRGALGSRPEGSTAFSCRPSWSSILLPTHLARWPLAGWRSSRLKPFPETRHQQETDDSCRGQKGEGCEQRIRLPHGVLRRTRGAGKRRRSRRFEWRPFFAVFHSLSSVARNTAARPGRPVPLPGATAGRGRVHSSPRT